MQLLAVVAALPLLLAGCAANQAYRDGQQFVAQGKVDEGLAKFEEAVKQEPQDAQYRSTWLGEREKALVRYDEQGDRLAANGARDAARKMYEHALAIESNNERALAGIAALETGARLDALMARAETLAARQQVDDARRVLNTVLTEAPANRRALALKRRLNTVDSGATRVDAALAVAYRKPIRIDFRDAPLKQIFDVISHSSGLNFIFDKDVKTDQRTSIFLKNSTIDATVRYVLATNQLEQQVLDENTVLIYPATAAKLKDYQELAVRTFFLTNTDAKTIANTLKTIVKSHDVVADEKLNMVMVRDTPEAIRMAEKLVALQDVAEPEVMLEVEVLEIQRTKLQNLGIDWPGSVTVTPLPVGSVISNLSSGSTGSSSGTLGTTGTTSSSGTSPSLTLSDLLHQTTRTLGLSSLQATANANLQDSDAKLLTNPRIRVRNHEKAKILIGERVPNITSTATSTGFVSQSVNYLDIGLTLQVEPTIFLDDSVGIKISLEVSSLLNQITGSSGTTAYEIGTRTASTVLQLKNGETDVLAGLIDSQERTSGNKVPGIGQLPVLGRLFGATTDDDKDTEIVLSITPHLVRNIQRPDTELAYFTSGTESNMRTMVHSNGLPTTTPSGTVSAATSGDDAARAGSNASQPGANGAYGSGANGAYGSGSNTSGAYGSNGAFGAGTGSSLGSDGAPFVGGGGTAGTAQMTIEGPPQVKVGDSVTIALAMQADQPISSISSNVSFDATKLQFVGVAEGDFLKQGGAPTSFSNRVLQGGKLVLSDSVAGTTGGASPGTLAVLSFKALAAASQTSVQVQPGSVIGVSGVPITMATPSAYTFGVVGSP